MFAIAGMSNDFDIIVWVVMGVLLVVFVWLIFRQRRQGRELRFELEQLSEIQKDNVEYEFVLKTMRLSTWHIDTRTRKLVIDDDFRDKSDIYIPIVGMEMLTSMPEGDRKRVMKTLDDLCSGRKEEAHEEYHIFLPHSNRSYWSESYAIVAERDVDGTPKRIVGTSKRIDDRKQMEEALIEARNRAEESDRLKSAFIANMSHEIRTPLNAIVGFTSVLPDITSDEERKALLDLIHENTQKLLRIIDDVVNISRIESGQEQIVLTAFDLNLVLTEHIDRYRGDLKPGVSMETSFAEESFTITTDLNRFNEIIKHLISNAVKFTSQGSVTVGYDKPADGSVCIWVRDTGVGIAEENLEKVFERFFKVDEFVPGAGLGLSICRTMANSLGGAVKVESQLGKGSTFRVKLPTQ